MTSVTLGGIYSSQFSRWEGQQVGGRQGGGKTRWQLSEANLKYICMYTCIYVWKTTYTYIHMYVYIFIYLSCIRAHAREGQEGVRGQPVGVSTLWIPGTTHRSPGLGTSNFTYCWVILPVQTQDFLRDHPGHGVEDYLLRRQVSMWAENSVLLCAEADRKDAGLEHGQKKGKRQPHSQPWAKRGWNEKPLSGFLPCWVVSFQWQERGWWQTFLDMLHKEVNHQNIGESSWWHAKWLSFALFGWEISHFLMLPLTPIPAQRFPFLLRFRMSTTIKTLPWLHLRVLALTIVLMAGKCWAEEKESPLFSNLNNLSHLQDTLYL